MFHLSAKIVSRANGSSVVASAAYRAAERLRDDRLGLDHDFSKKADVIHSEVMLPAGAPKHLSDRATLWNTVERIEKRRDAQLAREVELAIPDSFTVPDAIQLARGFVQREFVKRGMVVDLNLHGSLVKDRMTKMHAHVLQAMRSITGAGFGAKVREWNSPMLLRRWREAWANHVNAALANLDVDARIDHRTLAAQGIELEAQNKIGPAGSRRKSRGEDAERADEHRRIAHENGLKIIADPEIALNAITHSQATFTVSDIAKFAHRHSDGKEQFDAVMAAVHSSDGLVALGKDGRGLERLTSRNMIAVEMQLEQAAARLAECSSHDVTAAHRAAALVSGKVLGLVLSDEQNWALEHVTTGPDVACVVGHAGSGKSAMLGVARAAWEAGGYRVRGAALSGIAAENLEAGSGIAGRTIASFEYQWQQERELLTAQDVLVIDEAGLIGTRQLERVLSAAAQAGAKVVLVGDPEQLQAIEAGAAFRALVERHGAVEITGIRRQHDDWQRDATKAFATGRTEEAIGAYGKHGMVQAAKTRGGARAALVDGWVRGRIADPGKSRIILTHTNAEVRELNELARGRVRDAGGLGDDVIVATTRGERTFACGDRVMLLQNDRRLGVKNGTLAVIEAVSSQQMAVRLDDGRQVAFDLKDYAFVDHGYAATIHKSQGMTVDQAHVLATPGFDRHATYVALTRHRERVELHCGIDDFSDKRALVRILSRSRTKDMAGDYVDRTQAFGEDRQPRRQKTGMFDGFQPQPTPNQIAPELGREAQAVERYARCMLDIVLAIQQKVSVLPHQEEECAKARAALDLLRPHATQDLDMAFARNRQLFDEAANGRVEAAMRARDHETRVRLDPNLRFERFVDDERTAHADRAARIRAGDMIGLDHSNQRIGELYADLTRDPEVQALVSARERSMGPGSGKQAIASDPPAAIKGQPGVGPVRSRSGDIGR